MPTWFLCPGQPKSHPLPWQALVPPWPGYIMTRRPKDKEVAVPEGERVTSKGRALLHLAVGVGRRGLAFDRGVATSAGARSTWDSRFEGTNPDVPTLPLRVRSLFLIKALTLRQNTCLGWESSPLWSSSSLTRHGPGTAGSLFTGQQVSCLSHLTFSCWWITLSLCLFPGHTATAIRPFSSTSQIHRLPSSLHSCFHGSAQAVTWGKASPHCCHPYLTYSVPCACVCARARASLISLRRALVAALRVWSSLQPAESLAVASEFLVAACEMQFSDQGSNPGPCIGSLES